MAASLLSLVASWGCGDYLGEAARGERADGRRRTGVPNAILKWAKEQAARVWLRMDPGFPEASSLDYPGSGGDPVRGAAARQRRARTFGGAVPRRRWGARRSKECTGRTSSRTGRGAGTAASGRARRPGNARGSRDTSSSIISSCSRTLRGARGRRLCWTVTASVARPRRTLASGRTLSTSHSPRPLGRRATIVNARRAPYNPATASARTRAPAREPAAANLLHAGRELLGRVLCQRFSGERFRQLTSKLRVACSERAVCPGGDQCCSRWSGTLCKQLDMLNLPGGSPRCNALPASA